MGNAKRLARRITASIEMIESPDLEWDRFVRSLSPEDKEKAGGLFSESMVTNPPQNPQAQIRAIQERINQKTANRLLFSERYQGLGPADYTCDDCGAREQSTVVPEGWVEEGKEHYCSNCDNRAPAEGGGLVSILVGMRRNIPNADSDFHDWLEYDGVLANPDKLKELGGLLAGNAELAAWYIVKADNDQDNKPFESDLVRHSKFRITGDMIPNLSDEFISHNIVIPMFYGGHDRADKSGWDAIFARMNPVMSMISGSFIYEDDIDDFGPDDYAGGFKVDRATAERWIDEAKRSGLKFGDPLPTYKQP